MAVALVAAPVEFVHVLGPLPPGVTLLREATPQASTPSGATSCANSDLILWFVWTQDELAQGPYGASAHGQGIGEMAGYIRRTPRLPAS